MAANCIPTFFIVDDDGLMIEFITGLLEARGCSVTSEQNSTLAVKRIVEMKPDCLITDLVMPGVDGMRLIDDLREHAHFETMKIIMVTTRHNDMWKKAAKGKGVDGFVTKPLNADTFADQVMAIAAGPMAQNA